MTPMPAPANSNSGDALFGAVRAPLEGARGPSRPQGPSGPSGPGPRAPGRAPGGPGGGSRGGAGESGRAVGVATRVKPQTKKPSMYRVLLLNDDYTPMEFVILILEHLFSKSREEATRIMLHVHNHGVGVCGVYPFEVAETKVAQVLDLARRSEHPLQCTMERED